MINCILVGLGGFMGSVCRYLIGLLPVNSESGFPIKTLVINILGAFVIGLITVAAEKNKALDPHFILMLKVGICGGFTTFSTFAYETTELMQNGAIYTALIYVLASVVLSVLAVFGAQIIIR